MSVIEAAINDEGPTINWKKLETKIFPSGQGAVALKESLEVPVLVNGHKVLCLRELTYLGDKICSPFSSVAEVTCRVSKSTAAFSRLARTLFWRTPLKPTLLLKLYFSLVRVHLVAALEHHVLSRGCIQALERTQADQLWTLFRVHSHNQGHPIAYNSERISNDELRDYFGVPTVETTIMALRLRWVRKLFLQGPPLAAAAAFAPPPKNQDSVTHWQAQ